VELSVREAFDGDKDFIRDLLRKVKLPVETVDTGTTTFYVGCDNGKSIAVAGFEFYGNDALLRSVAIRPDLQRTGLGGRLTDWMVETAKQRGVRRIVLLTETAEKFFARKGFKVTHRSVLDNDAMQRSTEFTSACPQTAVCMMLDIGSRH